MPEAAVDRYLAEAPEPQRSTLTRLRATLAELLPEAEEGIAYGAPVFRVAGKPVAGFAWFQGHCTYLPHSGQVLAGLAGDLVGYAYSKGALKFAIDRPLPRALVARLVEARLRELGDA